MEAPRIPEPVPKAEVVRYVLRLCQRRSVDVKDYKTRAEIDEMNEKTKASNMLIRQRNHKRAYPHLYPAIEWLMKIGKEWKDATEIAVRAYKDDAIKDLESDLRMEMNNDGLEFNDNMMDDFDEETGLVKKKRVDTYVVTPKEPENALREYCKEATPTQWWDYEFPLLGWTEDNLVDMTRILNESKLFIGATFYYKETEDKLLFTVAPAPPLNTERVYDKLMNYITYQEEVERRAIGDTLMKLGSRVTELEKIVFLSGDRIATREVSVKEASALAHEDRAPEASLFEEESDKTILRKYIQMVEKRLQLLEAHKARGDQVFKMTAQVLDNLPEEVKKPSGKDEKKEEKALEKDRRPPRKSPMPEHVKERMKKEEEEKRKAKEEMMKK